MRLPIGRWYYHRWPASDLHPSLQTIASPDPRERRFLSWAEELAHLRSRNRRLTQPPPTRNHRSRALSTYFRDARHPAPRGARNFQRGYSSPAPPSARTRRIRWGAAAERLACRREKRRHQVPPGQETRHRPQDESWCEARSRQRLDPFPRRIPAGSPLEESPPRGNAISAFRQRRRSGTSPRD